MALARISIWNRLKNSWPLIYDDTSKRGYYKRPEDTWDPNQPHKLPKFPERWNYPKPVVPNADSYNASKLFAVWRIQTVGGRPYHEKLILTQLGLHKTTKAEPVILKNTPNICAQLWKIKHLIRVRPITFPYGEPTEGDGRGCWMDENGVFTVSKKLEVDLAQIEPNLEHLQTNFDEKELSEYLLRKWIDAYD